MALAPRGFPGDAPATVAGGRRLQYWRARCPAIASSSEDPGPHHQSASGVHTGRWKRRFAHRLCGGQ
eukprot:552976-Pyramimonas_sp.AAC.1